MINVISKPKKFGVKNNHLTKYHTYVKINEKGCDAQMFFVIIAGMLFVADTIIKHKIEKNISFGEIKEIFNNKLIIKKYHNTGAMLSAGAKRQNIVALISLAFTAFMSGIFVATLGLKGKTLLKTGLALILGGAFSNTYDRLARKYVVDYVAFKVDSKCKLLRRFQNVIFNISDFGIIIGAVLLVINELKEAD